MASDEQNLIEKLRRIEALFARPGTEGERDAAARARDRILERLGETASQTPIDEEPAVEYRFSLPDPWSQRLLHALLRHHGIVPYRRPGQRRQTVTARAPKSFIDEVVWPQFREFERELRDYFDNCTERIIEEALSSPMGKRPTSSSRFRTRA